MLLLFVPLSFGFLWLRNYLDSRPIDWVVYSETELDRYRAEGRTVLLNFTADWDPNCVFLERVTLESPSVKQWIRSHGVVAMRADCTYSPPEIMNALQKLGRNYAPVVAVYGGDPLGDPDVLKGISGIITEAEVLKALKATERLESIGGASLAPVDGRPPDAQSAKKSGEPGRETVE